jgi:hypothetical protein
MNKFISLNNSQFLNKFMTLKDFLKNHLPGLVLSMG